MNAVPDSLATNCAHWDERAPAHAASPDYDVDRFRTDPAFLSDVVRFDLPRLGDVNGLRGVHLQCHIGTDTVSLARLGASMTGLDFSPAALHQARNLAQTAGADVRFVEAELYRAADVLRATAGTTVLARSSPRCSTRAWSSRSSSSTTPSRGTLCPDR